MNSAMPRRATRCCTIGPISIGGGKPVVVQAMTNTDTADYMYTARQCVELAKAGAELVRISVNTPAAAAVVPKIAEYLAQQGYNTPLIGDFHYNGHRLLHDYPEMAATLAKYRINPGNVGFGVKKNDQFTSMIEYACRHEKAVRIGVNWGSIDQALLARLMDKNSRQPSPEDSSHIIREALVISALESAAQAESIGMSPNRIVLSCKVSAVQDLIAIYRELARRVDYPLHLGLTEAGMGNKGVVSSTAALAILLQEGIGDTIRVSLTPAPGESRSEEVLVAQEILQSMGLRAFKPTVIACPGCGRTTSTFFQQLAQQVQDYVRQKMPTWRSRHQGVENMTLAVMGCVVNGPGESKHANIGISLPGTGEAPSAPVFEDGKKTVTLKGENIAGEFIALVERYVERTYKAIEPSG